MGVKSLILTLLVISLLWRCERLTQPKVTDKVECRLEPVAALVTDAYWRLAVSDRPEGSELWVYRDEVLWQRKALTVGDSLFHDEGLPPGSRVRYRVEVRKGGVVIGRSNSLEMSLLDTTSHAVQWQVYEFRSPFGSGVFNDAAIVDEGDIWVVGEIYNDSVKNWLPYNAVHWDGQGWERLKIEVEYRNTSTLVPLYSVWCCLEGRVVFSSGLPYLPEGDGWKLYHLWDMGILTDTDKSVKRIHGINGGQLYFYGDEGTVVEYDTRSWKKIFIDTDLSIQEMNSDKKKMGIEILAVASDYYHRPGSFLYRIAGDRAELIADSTELTRGFAGLWFRSGKEYWLVGDGVYRSRLTPHNWKVEQSFPRYFSHAIAGTDVNDVWVVGAYGLVSHYNGRSWHHYGGAELPPHGALEKVAVTPEVVVAVGTIGGKGLIIMGKR